MAKMTLDTFASVQKLDVAYYSFGLEFDYKSMKTFEKGLLKLPPINLLVIEIHSSEGSKFAESMEAVAKKNKNIKKFECMIPYDNEYLFLAKKIHI